MKLSAKPLALAAIMALASAAAHAQLPAPGFGTAAPTASNNNSLIFYLFSPTAAGSTTPNYGEQVVLNYNYTQLSPATAGGPLTPNGATSPYVSATNPTGAAGNVLQLNFGVVPNFSIFNVAGHGALDYFVASSNGQTAGGNAASITTNTTLTTLNMTTSGIPLVSTDVATTPWNGTVVPSTGVDTSGAAAYNPIAAAVNGGNMNGINFAGAVNTALNFWNVFNTTVGRATTANVVQYASTNGAAFWFLSSTGDLTYNVPMAASTVPLPAAVWLLASGLAGLGAIGRRRRQELVGAAA